MLGVDYHDETKNKDVNDVGNDYPSVAFFPTGIFTHVRHFNEIMLAIRRKAPGTPSGNSLKKLSPV